jgi:hypothetical protein
MADVKISELPEASDDSSAHLAGVQGGATKKFPVSVLSEFLVPIWAEQNASLNTGSAASGTGWEFAYGNGADTDTNGGIFIYVPTGYECHIVAMGLSGQVSFTAEVRPVINGGTQAEGIPVSATIGGFRELTTPIALTNGQRLGFVTISGTGTTGPHQVVAWLRMRRT